MSGAQRPPHVGAVALISFILLACGGAAGPHPWDVGELAAAAAQLGGSHAPGQPLHALLGHAMLALPLGSFVLRLSWLSALGAACASYAAGRAVLALVDRIDAVARAAAVLAAIAIALTPAVLRSAMRPEVYALALACVTGSAWALGERSRGYAHGLRVTAILAGLAFALHPPHALAIASMALVACVLMRPSRTELGSSLGLGLVVTLALIAYLPIRGAAGAPCWGDPTTPSGLWAYVSGAAYQRNLGTGGRDALAVARYLVVEGGGAPLIFGVFALRDRALRLPWGMALVAIVAALLQPFEERNPDNVAYDAPALALTFAAAAATLVRVTEDLPRLRLASIVLPLAPLCASLAGEHLVSADLPALETLAFETLSSPAPRALLVTRTDFVAASAMLGQSVDGLRPDVAVFAEGLATSSWHWRSLAGHPAFDGAPHRGAGRDPRHAYVVGALDHARGRVEIDVENASTIGGHGVVRGALLVEGPDSLDARSTAERTMGAVASSLAWTRDGDHGIGAQIVRDVVMRRAPLLFARSQGALARSELRVAAPVAARAIASLGDGPFARAPALLVRDPDFALASCEDAVRDIAVLLDQRGLPVLATAVLAAQQERGDDLAIAQLAAIELSDGLVPQARSTLDTYRARNPDVRSADLDALAAALGP